MNMELLSRKESRVAPLAQKLGPRNLINLLHFGQIIFNLLPPLRVQGNKFFCAISKRELQPWIETREGRHYLKKAGPKNSRYSLPARNTSSRSSSPRQSTESPALHRHP